MKYHFTLLFAIFVITLLNAQENGKNPPIDVTLHEETPAIPNDTLPDSDALNKLVGTGKSLYFPSGTYLIDKRMRFRYDNVVYEGDPSGESVLLLNQNDNDLRDNYIGSITGNNITFRNLVFDGNFLDINVALMEMVDGVGIRFENCTFRNIKGSEKGGDYCTAIRLDLSKVQNFTFHQVQFENISSLAKDEMEKGGGLTGAIYMFSTIATSQIRPSNGIISNCVFKNIFTEGATKDKWNANAIRIFVTSKFDSLETNSNIRIENNHFEGIQKTAVKIRGARGVFLRNNQVISNRNDIVEMLAPFRIQWGKDIIVEDTYLKGRFDHVFNLIGSDIYVNNVRSLEDGDYIVENSTFLLQKLSGVKNKNIIINGIENGTCKNLINLSTWTRDEQKLNYFTSSIVISNINTLNQMTFIDGPEAIINLRKTERATINNVYLPNSNNKPILLEDCGEVIITSLTSAYDKDQSVELKKSEGGNNPNNVNFKNFRQVNN